MQQLIFVENNKNEICRESISVIIIKSHEYSMILLVWITNFHMEYLLYYFILSKGIFDFGKFFLSLKNVILLIFFLEKNPFCFLL